MSTETSTYPTQKDRSHWWVVLIQGIAAIVLGILLLGSPAETTLLLIQLLGIYWLVSGVMSIVSLFRDRSMWGWKLFVGLLGIVAGILTLQHPYWSALIIPTTAIFFLGFLGIFIGIGQIIQAFRGEGWGIGILGALSIVVGIMLLTRPVIAGLALPFVLGVLAIFGGIVSIFGAFRLKNWEEKADIGIVPASRVGPVVQPGPGIGEPMGTAAGAAAAGIAVTGTAAVAAASDTKESADVTDETVNTVSMAGAEYKVEAADVVASPGGVSGDIDRPLETVGEAAGEAQVFTVVTAEDVDQVLSNMVTRSDPQEMSKFKASLEYVERVGPDYAEKLRAINIHTPLDLLKMGAFPKGRDEIARRTGIDSHLILKWVNHVDLYRIKGVSTEYANLLETSDVDTVVELAHRNPVNLISKMTSVNTDQSLVRRLPTVSQVEDWVNQAKRLPRVVTY